MSNPELLLGHVPFMKQLSRALVADVHTAEDLVQDTCIAALERPPRDRSAIRAWLRRVMKNKLVSDRRHHGRRARRERAAAPPESLPPLSEVAERISVARQVVEAVSRLDEPYRSVILQRYYEELPPRIIANRLQIPVETVRTRIKRGLERLRTLLDRENQGRRAAWTGALAVFSGEKGSHLAGSTLGQSAATALSVGTPQNTLASWTLGGLLMSAKASVVTLSVSLSATLALAVLSCYLYLEYSDAATRRDALAVDLDGLDRRLEKSLTDGKDLERRLALAAQREDELARRLARLEQETAAARAAATAAAETPKPEVAVADEAPREALIATVEEADALVAEMLRKGDVEGLWLLAADLLRFGEEGYEKVIELAAQLDDMEKDSPIRTLWHQEELLVGPFLRTVLEHRKDVLRFAIYLENHKSRAELPDLLGEVRRLITDDEGAVLVGLYGGDDPEINDSLTKMYGNYIDAKAANSRDLHEVALSLGHIPSAASTGLLLEMIERAPDKNTRRTAIQALTWQRSPQALPALRKLKETETDPELGVLLDRAIRFLE